jgi:hypothetical protein
MGNRDASHAMSDRERLPDRRVAELVDFTHAGRWWTATVGRFADGRICRSYAYGDGCSISHRLERRRGNDRPQVGNPLVRARRFIRLTGGPQSAPTARRPIVKRQPNAAPTRKRPSKRRSPGPIDWKMSPFDPETQHQYDEFLAAQMRSGPS